MLAICNGDRKLLAHKELYQNLPDMTHKALHQICSTEKQKAIHRSECADVGTHFDSLQAVNAFDELVGQLHKPGKVKQKQFRKAKETALKMVNMISDPQYRSEMTHKIHNLTLT